MTAGDERGGRRLNNDDVVLRVDGHKVTQDDITKYVRGSNKLGTPVTLTVRRAATGVTEDVVCLRAPSSFVDHTKDLYLLLEQSRLGTGFSGGTSALVDKIEMLLPQLETNHLALQDHLRKHVRGLEMELEELLLACQDMMDSEHVSHDDVHGDAPVTQVPRERVGALERELMNDTEEAERLRGKVAQLERERQNFASEEELRAEMKTLEKQLLFLGRSGAEEELHAKVRSLEELFQTKDAAHERELEEGKTMAISDSTQQEKATPTRMHAQARSEAGSKDASSGHKGVPGSARWLKERNEALEQERLALVKQTLEFQSLLDSVKQKQKVRTARDTAADMELDDGQGMAQESERMLDEKQELISRLIVQSQQAFFMAMVSRGLLF